MQVSHAPPWQKCCNLQLRNVPLKVEGVGLFYYFYFLPLSRVPSFALFGLLCRQQGGQYGREWGYTILESSLVMGVANVLLDEQKDIL